MNRLRPLLILVLVLIACNEGDQLTVEEMERSIHAGIERTDLEDFCERNDITYSILEGDELALESDLEVEPNQVSARYVATIRDVGRWMLLYKQSIVIKVDFDADGKASHVKVYKSRTGI